MLRIGLRTFNHLEFFFLNCPFSIQEIYYESVYQLNKDYTISIDSDDSSGVTYFNVGANEIKWKGKSLTYEVKKIESFFHGLCQTIWPKNVLLEPGDIFTIHVHSNLTLKGCKLFL